MRIQRVSPWMIRVVSRKTNKKRRLVNLSFMRRSQKSIRLKWYQTKVLRKRKKERDHNKKSKRTTMMKWSKSPKWFHSIAVLKKRVEPRAKLEIKKIKRAEIPRARKGKKIVKFFKSTCLNTLNFLHFNRENRN